MCQIEPRDAANDNSERVIVAELDAAKLDTFREHWPFNLDFDLPQRNF